MLIDNHAQNPKIMVLAEKVCSLLQTVVSLSPTPCSRASIPPWTCNNLTL